ncbi:hypothetical protein BBJ66_31590 [Rhizobium sp. RSm-3]|nr:hypothetical protein BBJ66_31590 [Rhizobium sp. RSm-3]
MRQNIAHMHCFRWQFAVTSLVLCSKTAEVCEAPLKRYFRNADFSAVLQQFLSSCAHTQVSEVHCGAGITKLSEAVLQSPHADLGRSGDIVKGNGLSHMLFHKLHCPFHVARRGRRRRTTKFIGIAMHTAFDQKVLYRVEERAIGRRALSQSPPGTEAAMGRQG